MAEKEGFSRFLRGKLLYINRLSSIYFYLDASAVKT
jgi:hypothetical protein